MTVATPPSTIDANADAQRRRRIRRLALACAGLMLLTTIFSAYIRHVQAGLGCADWPACYGQGLRALQQRMGDPTMAAGHAGVAAARLAHRVVATLALLLVIALVLVTRRLAPPSRGARATALALLVLALGLAALGIATPGARLPAVGMANLLGGFAMLALCWRLAGSGAPVVADAAGVPGAAGAMEGLGAWAVAGLALLTGQLTLGALVSTSLAALSCTGLAECMQAIGTSGWDWRSMNPWREPVFDALQPVHKAGASALSAHAIGALVVLPVTAWLGALAWRQGRRREGGTLLALTLAQGALGPLIVAAGLPLSGVLLHNLSAALMLAALVRWL